MAGGGTTARDEAARRRALVGLSSRYCWDAEPTSAPHEADRVLLRVMDIGTWNDLQDLERTFGHDRLLEALRKADAGALTPRSWTFWHYRLGLADADKPPPPLPDRRMA